MSADATVRRERLRRGVGSTRHTSRVTSPTAAIHSTKRYRFVFADSVRRSTSAKRREAVAEYVTGWMGGEIVGERQCGTECVVLVELPRAVTVSVAEQFIRECPNYVRDTFAPCG